MGLENESFSSSVGTSSSCIWHHILDQEGPKEGPEININVPKALQEATVRAAKEYQESAVMKSMLLSVGRSNLRYLLGILDKAIGSEISILDAERGSAEKDFERD